MALGLRPSLSFLVGLLVWPAALLGVSPPAAADEPAVRRIAAVAGPDTLRLEDGTIARLAGVHVPSRQSLAAAETLRREVAPGGEALALALELRFDRYGRRLIRAEARPGRDLAVLLIRQGLALVRPEPDLALDVTGLLVAEERARRAARGIWGGPDPPLAAAASAERLIGRYGVVEGRVLSTGTTKRHVYLNFGSDWRSDFTVRLRRSELNEVADRSVEDVERLAGREVRARGLVIMAGGPLVEVSHPEQIEVLR